MNFADTRSTDRAAHARVTVDRWGTLPGGDAVRLFTLRNVHGMRVVISDLGATLVSWHAADRAGRIADVVLGHDTPADYLASSSSAAQLGAGRTALRMRALRSTT